MPLRTEFEIISTCPESVRVAFDEYLERVVESARWCEAEGHSAMVVHADHRLLDPWVVAQIILSSTSSLRPIVTVQPLYMHPYTVAKKVGTLARLFGRSPDLNLVAGGFRSDLLALDDSTSHDDRYARLVEYGTVVHRLLSSEQPVEFDGLHYRLHKPRSLARLPQDMQPRLYVAATSASGRAAAAELGATPVGQLGLDESAECLRLGIVARPEEGAAWDAAIARFPGGRGSHLQNRLEVSLGDSAWQRGLGELAERENSPLWMQPYESRQAACAYLVGDYRTISRRIVQMFTAGTRAFVLDTPADDAELGHVRTVFERAWSRFSSPLAVSV